MCEYVDVAMCFIDMKSLCSFPSSVPVVAAQVGRKRIG